MVINLKVGLFFYLFVCIPFPGSTQIREREILYESYIKGKMPVWRTVIDSINNNLAFSAPKEKMILLDAYYGYIPWCLSTGRKEEARQDLESAIKLLDELFTLPYGEKAVMWARKSAFLGYLMAMNKILIVFLWPQSKLAVERSLQTDDMNPAGWEVKGNALYYIPEVFGGSKEKGIKHYKKAISLMERDRGELQKNWIYLNLLAHLGMAYSDRDNPGKAVETYEKLLSIEPRFDWVSNHLLPEARKKSRKGFQVYLLQTGYPYIYPLISKRKNN